LKQRAPDCVLGTTENDENTDREPEETVENRDKIEGGKNLPAPPTTVLRVLDTPENSQNTGNGAEETAENNKNPGSYANALKTLTKRNTGNRIVVPEGETIATTAAREGGE